jgi:hypothetical protein
MVVGRSSSDDAGLDGMDPSRPGFFQAIVIVGRPWVSG